MPGQVVATISANSDFLFIGAITDWPKSIWSNSENNTYDAIPLNSTFNNLTQYKVYVNSENMLTGDRIVVDVIVYNGNAIKLPFDAVLNQEG